MPEQLMLPLGSLHLQPIPGGYDVLRDGRWCGWVWRNADGTYSPSRVPACDRRYQAAADAAEGLR